MWRNAVRGRSFFRSVVGLVALFFLVSPLGAQADGTPSVIASGQGAAVAISNWTAFTIQQPSPEETSQTAGQIGPGFPFALWPMQTSGTSIVMRGGVASDGEVSTGYVIQNGADPQPGFKIGFEADSDWNFKAAASLLLHTGKSYAVGKAKKTIKKSLTPSDSAEDSVEDDPDDGVAEVIKGVKEVEFYYKVVKLIAKVLEALAPQFVMNIELGPISGTTQVTNACLTMYQSTPGVANVQIFGPDENITPDNEDSFFVVSAGAANGFSPGIVDVGVNGLCDWVCGVWNGSLELLTTMDLHNCNEVSLGGDTQEADYNEAQTRNNCLAEPSSGPAGVPWVAAAYANDVYVRAPENFCHPQLTQYPAAQWTAAGVTNSICGTCPGPAYNQPLGSWTENCDEVNWVPDQVTLTAKCATDSSSERTVQSTRSCETGYWTSVDGQLACENPPGSWSESCTFETFSDGTLCAQCYGFGGQNSSCATCPSGSWYNDLGQLMCEPLSSDSQAQKLPPPGPTRSLDPFPADSDTHATRLAGCPLSNGGGNS